MNPKIHRPVSSQPRRSAAERCGRRQVEMRSEMLGITGDSSTDLVEPIDNAGTGLQITETLSSEWTDEKHCLYLNFMEASFVKQLYSPDYRSIDLLGHHSSLINRPDPSSLHSNANNSIPSSQFKVIQGGSLKRINFERARPKLNNLNNSHLLLENQWVRHFRSTRKQKVALSNMQEKSTSSSESICSIGQKKSIHGAATCSKEINAGMHHQNSICNGAEVSDQNFIDEEHEAKQISRLCPSKKTRLCLLISESN